MSSKTKGGAAKGAAASRAIITQDTIVTSGLARKALAVLRIFTGFVFLWPFLDKTFGLGFSTPSERAWIHGGKPSQGFLKNIDPSQPLSGLYASLASPVSDILFMVGLLGIGLAIMLGIGIRVGAWSGAILATMMYLSGLPFIVAEGGMSTNPIVDSHIIYIAAFAVLGLTMAGDTWGLGRWWKSLPIVQKNRWLI